jgi:hypothetical protein
LHKHLHIRAHFTFAFLKRCTSLLNADLLEAQAKEQSSQMEASCAQLASAKVALRDGEDKWSIGKGVLHISLEQVR